MRAEVSNHAAERARSRSLLNALVRPATDDYILHVQNNYRASLSAWLMDLFVALAAWARDES